jgi:hypothetical protein
MWRRVEDETTAVVTAELSGDAEILPFCIAHQEL